MDRPVDFFELFGLFGALVAAALVTLINSLALWLTMNYVLDERGSAGYRRCLLASALLVLLALPFALVYFLIPIRIIGAIIGLGVVAKGAKMIIAGLFELPRGGTAATALVLLVMGGVWLAVGAARSRPDAQEIARARERAEFVDRVVAARQAEPPRQEEMDDATLAVRGAYRDRGVEKEMADIDPKNRGLGAITLFVSSRYELFALGRARIELRRETAPGEFAATPLSRIEPALEDGTRVGVFVAYKTDGSISGSSDPPAEHPISKVDPAAPRHYYLSFMQSPAESPSWRLVLKTDATLDEWKALPNLSGEFAD